MNHFISLAEATTMTTRYRQHRETILKQEYQEQAVLPLCETFKKDAVNTILEKEGCESLRIYYGMDENYKVHAILVAVNEMDEDMIPASGLTENEEDEDILERSFRCPDVCPPDSPLNDNP